MHGAPWVRRWGVRSGSSRRGSARGISLSAGACRPSGDGPCEPDPKSSDARGGELGRNLESTDVSSDQRERGFAMPMGILERLAEGPVLGDGGYLLELEKRGYVQAGPFTPEVAIEHPEALAELHREFMRAGAEVLTTMTFYASDDKLATVGMKAKVDEINRAAVRVAREVAGEGDALVAGDLSLTWAYDQQEPASADHVRALFDRQLQDMLDAGPPDFWVGETFSFVGEALLFVERAKATGLPVMVTMCFEQPEPRSYEGDTPAECARKLADAGADVVGVNCLNGPDQQ